MSFSPLELKTKNTPSRYQSIVSMSTPQAVGSFKVSVSPMNLEDAKNPPLNIYKPKEPYTATIVSVERLVGPKAPGETCHIVIDHGGNVPYWEGQSYGVIPTGENPKKPGAPHNVRLYSIASTRYGDSFDGKTASIAYNPVTSIFYQFKGRIVRLGADVLVFTRCPGQDGRSPTQSIGMLSYTFLMETGKEDIVVPMIAFEKRGQDWGMMVRSSPLH